MPATRSSLPRNRSGVTRSPLPPLRVSPCPPSSRTIARQATLLASYIRKYPISTELGFVGLLPDRRRHVNLRINEVLTATRPRPPSSRHLDRRHQGHNLTGPQQNKGITSLQGIASWHQVCTGCARCTKSKGRVFRISDPLQPAELREEPLRQLLKAREELYPKRPQPLTTEDAAAACASATPGQAPAPAPVQSTPTPTPSPEPGPATADDDHERLTTPLTPTVNGLHFDYSHYSPEGYIIRSGSPSTRISDAISDFSEDLDLQYPPPDILDLCTPVLLLVWLDAAEPPIHMMVYPRAEHNANITVHIGDVVLNDFRAALQLRGLPAGAEIERFLDATDHWLCFSWSTGIPVYGRNKVIYIRLVGVDITAPDHFAELFLTLDDD